MRSGKDETRDDLEAFGVSQEELDSLAEDEEEEPFPVLETNWETLLFFLAVQRHWRYAPLGGVVGLDWGVVQMEIDHGGREMNQTIWNGLKLIERIIVTEFMNKRDE